MGCYAMECYLCYGMLAYGMLCYGTLSSFVTYLNMQDLYLVKKIFLLHNLLKFIANIQVYLYVIYMALFELINTLFIFSS